MTTFVAYDGEGLTRSKDTCACGGEKEHEHIARHDYVLLAASDGTYVEEYADGGLSTEQCFEYLLDLGERNKGAILVGFYTSYDVNMMFRDLPRAVLEGLWEGRTRSWRAKEGDYRQYRLEYVPNRVLRIKQGCWVSREDGDGGVFWKTFRSVTCWDCFQFFQMSFVKALKDWKATDAETIDRISAMKDARGTFEDGQQEAIREYCQEECKLLVETMDKVAGTLDLLELKLTSWYGAGSIASALFKKHGVKQHIKRDWNDDVTAAIMSAYFGGRVETFAVGVVDIACMNYDVRSAYPSATANLPSLDSCEVKHVFAYDTDAQYAIWRVKWTAARKPARLTPFPFRHNKRIFWPHTGEGWYHAAEVSAALAVFEAPNGRHTGAITFEVCEGYIFEPWLPDARPFAWVPQLYDERAEYKRNGDPREKILKLGLNSVYGKCAQSIGGMNGEPPPYQCYLWAGMITADCRAKLLRAAALSDSVLAIATDGLFTVAPVAELIETDELGGWESTAVEPGLMLIQPGVYATPNLGKVAGSFAKSRGFSARGINYERLLEGWRERRMAAAATMPETRFIGFGYALAINKLDSLWRRWVSGDKTIHFSGTTSKSFDPTGSMDAELVFLVAPAAPSEISAAYVPRTRSKDDAKEYELQSELLASQPDLDDNMFAWRE